MSEEQPIIWENGRFISGPPCYINGCGKPAASFININFNAASSAPCVMKPVCPEHGLKVTICTDKEHAQLIAEVRRLREELAPLKEWANERLDELAEARAEERELCIVSVKDSIIKRTEAVGLNSGQRVILTAIICDAIRTSGKLLDPKGATQ